VLVKIQKTIYVIQRNRFQKNFTCGFKIYIQLSFRNCMGIKSFRWEKRNLMYKVVHLRKRILIFI